MLAILCKFVVRFDSYKFLKNPYSIVLGTLKVAPNIPSNGNTISDDEIFLIFSNLVE